MILWTRKNVAQSKNVGEVCERINVYNEKVLLFFFCSLHRHAVVSHMISHEIHMKYFMCYCEFRFTGNSHEV